MEILLVGQADSVFFEQFTKNLKRTDPKIIITVFSFDPIKRKNDLSACNAVFESTWYKSPLRKIRGIRTLMEPLFTTYCFFLFLKKNNKKYDIIHFKWLRASILFSLFFIKKFSNKSVAMLWGGEFESQKIFFSKRIYYFFFKLFINKMDIITYATEEGLKALEKFVDQKEKLKFAIYGSNIVKEIQEKIVKDSRIECKQKFGIEDSQTSISIGYSGKKIHQHLEVLSALLYNDSFVQEKDKFFFLIPMTYGRDERYLKIIENFMIENGLHFKILIDKLTNSKVADLRLATDIFIQVTTFDGRSSSVVEYLLAGSIMIAGSWLPYSIFKEKHLHFYEIDEIDTYLLPSLVLNISEHIKVELMKTKINRERWGFHETWEGVMANWINNIYDINIS